MIYVSAYQVIRENIENNTEWGKKLKACQTFKAIDSSLNVRDQFQEAQYSPVHFDLKVVFELLNHTIISKRTNQKFVLLEGLCNSMKLSEINDQLEMRFMDELFGIEEVIGEVAAVIALQSNAEAEFIREDQIVYEKFPEPEPVEEKKKPAEGEEESGAEQEQPEEDGEEKKKPAFNPAEYQWTVSDRKAKNLPQLYLGCKGINTLHEVKEAKDFDTNNALAISKCLDDFCARLQDADNSDKYLYQQVVF